MGEQATDGDQIKELLTKFYDLRGAIQGYARTAPIDLMTAAEIQLDLLAIADGKDPPSQTRGL